MRFVLDFARVASWLPIVCFTAADRSTVSTWCRPWSVTNCMPRGPRWRLPLETSTEHSSKSEGMIRPVTLWSGQGFYLLNTPAQPKHDARPCPLGCCVLTEVLL